MVTYPLVDVLAAVIDLRSSAATRRRTALYTNMAVSLIAAIFFLTSAIHLHRRAVQAQ